MGTAKWLLLSIYDFIDILMSSQSSNDAKVQKKN